MSVQKLQELIRKAKTPLALGLTPRPERLPEKLMANFEDMFGPGPMARCEALRYHACQSMDAAAGKLSAVVIDAEGYLCCGPMGGDVLYNLISAARAKGFYVIADCRTTRPELWLTAENGPDGVTVLPYVGEDCVYRGGDKSVFAVVRSGNESGGEVQNLIAGDRPLYVALAQQMARHGAGLCVETGYSLDIRQVRRRCEEAFLLLPHCDGENAADAFDEYGHGAMLVDYELPYGGDIDKAIGEVKGWVSVL